MVNVYFRPCLLAVAVLIAPATASAQDPVQQLSATVHVGLTILPSATVGTRLRSRGGSEFFVEGSTGKQLGASDFEIVYRDRRGERLLRDQAEIGRAIADSGKTRRFRSRDHARLLRETVEGTQRSGAA